MTISIVDTQAASANNTTSTVVPAPTVADGDLMVLAITIDDSAGLDYGAGPVAAGWTLYEQIDAGEDKLVEFSTALDGIVKLPLTLAEFVAD